MISLMKGSRGRDLENMVAHAQPSYARPSGNALPSNVAFNDGYSGPSFFERLFGPPTPPAPIGRRGVQQPQQQRRVITR
jgi:hypothetical protein